MFKIGIKMTWISGVKPLGNHDLSRLTNSPNKAVNILLSLQAGVRHMIGQKISTPLTSLIVIDNW